MVQAIERYMKQAIVDRNPSVSSAALVSAMVSQLVDLVTNNLSSLLNIIIPFADLQHLFQRGTVDVVKRWVNETQEAVTSDNVMVQVCLLLSMSL